MAQKIPSLTTCGDFQEKDVSLWMLSFMSGLDR